MTVSALVLAGGRATRMGGAAKHALVVGGRSIFERQVAVLAPLVDEILVSGVEVPGYRSVVDVEDGVGPLAGIAAGLAAVTAPWMLVVAGDMPDISGALVEALIAGATADVEASGVRIGGLPEPLLCVLRVAPARDALARLFAQRRYKASALLDALRVAWLDEAAVRAIDPALRSLRNVNAPGDL